MYNPTSRRCLRILMVALALTLTLPGGGNPRRTAEAHPASAPSASLFYPITKTAYDAWTTSTSLGRVRAHTGPATKLHTPRDS